MRAMVTGGAGFIGSHLVEALVARGDDVTCVERPGAPRGWVEHLPIEWSDDGLEDEAALTRRLEGIDVVYHLAALTEARTPSECYRVNTEGTANLFRAAAAHHEEAPRIVLLSSLAALGPCRNGDRLSAHTVPYPLSHYGHSKLLAEAVAHGWLDIVPSAILRLPPVYGPRERSVLKMFRMIQHGVALTIGSWDRELNLIYVKDAVQGMIAAAESPKALGRAWCLAYPETVTWRRFAGAVAESLARHPALVSVPTAAARPVARVAELVAAVQHKAAVLNRDRVRELSQERWLCDTTPAIREIGFHPEWPMARGIPATAAWYREVRWL